MIDFSWTELSLGLSLLFNISFLIFVVVYYRRCVYQPIWQKEKTSFWLMLFSLLLIILVSTNSGSDWYSYQSMVWNYDLRMGAVNHGEPVYRYIIGFVNRNYLLFRLIVWGGAFLLTFLAFKRFEVNVNIAVYFLIVVFLHKYNYARATLAMASYYLGLSYLIKPIKNHKLFSILLMVLLFWGAYEFHHSLLPVLILSTLAFLPINKPFVFLVLLVLLPLLAMLISSNFEIVDSIGDEYINSKFESYVGQESGSANFYGQIANILSYGAFIVPIVFTALSMFKHGKVVEITFLRLFRVTFSIALFSASFLFMGLQSYIFVYRYLFMTMIPLTILSVYLYNKKLMNKTQFSIIVLWGAVASMQPLLVGLYNLL